MERLADRAYLLQLRGAREQGQILLISKGANFATRQVPGKLIPRLHPCSGDGRHNALFYNFRGFLVRYAIRSRT